MTTERKPLPPELEPWVRRDPIVRACWQMYEAGDLTYEACLVLMVVELAKLKVDLTSRVLYLLRTRPAPILVNNTGEPKLRPPT